jgi:hypothetical protein
VSCEATKGGIGQTLRAIRKREAPPMLTERFYIFVAVALTYFAAISIYASL